jgi:hypothetical protein
MVRRILGPAFACFAAVACVGDISAENTVGEGGGDADRQSPGAGPGAGATVTAAVPGVTVPAGTRFTYACTSPDKQGLGNSGVRRLTRAQLTNTLRDLLGADVLGDSEVQVALNRLGADALTADVAQFPLSPPADQPGALAALAARAADLAAAPKKAAALFGSCAADATITDACVTSFATAFGQRALRRPLAPAEVTSYVGTFHGNGGGMGGLQAVLMRFLQSPAFVFRIEAGKAVVGGRVQLADHEIASRVSYLVANTMPDDALLAAAASGQLQDLTKVRAHVERLLDGNAAAQDKLKQFIAFYADINDTESPFATVATARRIDAKGLEAEMIAEATEFGAYHALKKQGSTFRDLLASTAAFPRSARLASVLETGVAMGAEPAQTTAQHAGLLLRPAVLASGQSRTPAMHRGKVVRQRFLCGALPPPPPEANAAITAGAADRARMGNRAWLEMVTSQPACIGCHRMVNPLGFALEGYDQLGMPRTSETAYDNAGKAGAMFPIDTKVSALAINVDDPGASAADALEMVRAIAESPAARACIAQTAFEYYHLRVSAPDADGCALRALETAATDGGSLRALFIANMANDDIFWRKAN